jgi:hypothetical protein
MGEGEKLPWAICILWAVPVKEPDVHGIIE